MLVFGVLIFRLPHFGIFSSPLCGAWHRIVIAKTCMNAYTKCEDTAYERLSLLICDPISRCFIFFGF